MARTASSRARPTTPPAIPPATAAVFDFGAGLLVWNTGLSVVVAAGLLSTGVGVAEFGAIGPGFTPTDDAVDGSREEAADEDVVCGFQNS